MRPDGYCNGMEYIKSGDRIIRAKTKEEVSKMTIKLAELSPKVRRKIAAQESQKRDAREHIRSRVAEETYRLERDLIRDVLKMVESLGVFAWRNNTGAAGTGKSFVRFGLKGSADIIGVLAPSGRFLAIECKAKGEMPTIEQLAFLDRITRNGGVAGVVWTLDDVRKLVKSCPQRR